MNKSRQILIDFTVQGSFLSPLSRY